MRELLRLIFAILISLLAIATKVTGCVGAVVDNGMGLPVDVDNAEQLEEAMRQLAHDSGSRDKLGLQGRERVKKLFDSKRLIAKHIALYERILGKKTGN